MTQKPCECGPCSDFLPIFMRRLRAHDIADKGEMFDYLAQFMQYMTDINIVPHANDFEWVMTVAHVSMNAAHEGSRFFLKGTN